MGHRPERHGANGAEETASPAQRRSGDERLPEFAERFGEALRTGDPAGAGTVAAEAVEAGVSVERFHSYAIAPAMWRIGELWESGAISVAEEHLATAISHQVMASLFPHLLQAGRRAEGRVVLAAAQGEHHILGLKMIADALEGAGYEVRYLGPDVPLEALVEFCDAYRPDVVGLTATMWLNVPTLIWEIEEIGRLEEPPAVIVGGRSIGELEKAGIEAPVAADCDSAIALVESLTRQPRLPATVDPEPIAGPVPVSSADPQAGDAVDTIAGAFSATSLAAADAAREAARRSFELELLAYRDPLTGLWNRRAYDDQIHRLAAGRDTPGAALMIDVDSFKGINDSHGHEAGDRALVEVGRAILKSIRPEDFAARFGGDEFVVLAPGLSPDDAGRLGERIRAAVESSGAEPVVTVSVGVAPLSEDGLATVIAADTALHGAKRAGRNRVGRAGVS